VKKVLLLEIKQEQKKKVKNRILKERKKIPQRKKKMMKRKKKMKIKMMTLFGIQILLLKQLSKEKKKWFQNH